MVLAILAQRAAMVEERLLFATGIGGNQENNSAQDSGAVYVFQ
jgi:hypothetical protein